MTKQTDSRVRRRRRGRPCGRLHRGDATGERRVARAARGPRPVPERHHLDAPDLPQRGAGARGARRPGPAPRRPRRCARCSTPGASSATRSPAPSPRWAGTNACTRCVASPWTPSWSRPPWHAGVELRTGVAVQGLVGAGTAEDPVRGVVLDDGSVVEARWVIGADGRTSTVARRLGLATTDPQRGNLAMLFAYWTGLPDSDWCQIDVQNQSALMSAPCEDGAHLLAGLGPARDHPRLRRGPAGGLPRRPAALPRRPQPAPAGPRDPGRAGRQRAGDDDARVPPYGGRPRLGARRRRRRLQAPRHRPGDQRRADPGLVRREPARDGGDLAEYESWRDARDAGHYEFSFNAGTLATPGAAATYSGLAGDPVASQEFLDIFTKQKAPQDVLTPERVNRWRTAWTYEQGLLEVGQVLDAAGDHVLEQQVPACPEWSVGDLLAHLAGVAADSATSGFFADATNAWRDRPSPPRGKAGPPTTSSSTRSRASSWSGTAWRSRAGGWWPSSGAAPRPSPGPPTGASPPLSATWPPTSPT